MTALIASSSIKTCLGDGAATFAAALAGKSGAAPLALVDCGAIAVERGYPIADSDLAHGEEIPLRAGALLTACVADAIAGSGIRPERQKTLAIVGTGLRELRTIECLGRPGWRAPSEQLHFAQAVQRAAPAIDCVVTVSNACSAGGHALALAEDLLSLGEAEAVVVAGADTMSISMLAMIGRVAETPTQEIRPFDRDRAGVLLGEGAAAIVLVPEGACESPLGRLLATGLSCDARHETAPDADGVAHAIRDALTRAGAAPTMISLVVAHGTGTQLNDPLEAKLIEEIFCRAGGDPLVTAIKGAVGHTSGVAALVNLDLALRCLDSGTVPPIGGLRTALPEGGRLRLVTGFPARWAGGIAAINAFGFGGVNAVGLVANARRKATASETIAAKSAKIPAVPVPDPPRLRSIPETRVAVTAWALHLPGIDLSALDAAVPSEACGPEEAARVIGRKGLLYKEPATRLALCAVHAALGLPPGAPRSTGRIDSDVAVVASSNFGNVATVKRIAAMAHEGKAREVSAMDAPNASSNIIASATAIWFGFGGPNLMLCSGATSGLDAIAVGRDLIRAGRARRVVVVGAEPDDETASLLQARREAIDAGALAGKLRAGAAAVILDRADHAPATALRLGASRTSRSLAAAGVSHSTDLFIGPRAAAPAGARAIDLGEIAGDFYGADGVIKTALAAALFAAAPPTAKPAVTILCGDRIDGWRCIAAGLNREKASPDGAANEKQQAGADHVEAQRS